MAHDFLRALLRLAIVHGNFHPLASQGFGHTTPDPRPAAGDQGYAIFQAHISYLRFRTSVALPFWPLVEDFGNLQGDLFAVVRTECAPTSPAPRRH